MSGRRVNFGKESGMYAVVETGSKQYRIGVGEDFDVERLEGEEGEKISLDKVLMVADGDNVHLGRPYVEGAKVEAEIVRHGRGPKLVVFKMKRRKNMRRKAGHRQDLTTLKVTDITV